MKTLKPKFNSFFFLLLISFGFMSCSSDDNSPNDVVTQDLIIDKWFFESAEEREPLTACEKTGFLEFYDDGTAGALLFVNNSAGACIPLLDTQYKFELVSENTIKFTVINDGVEGSVFNSEIVSVSGNKLVLKDFAFMTGKVQFKK